MIGKLRSPIGALSCEGSDCLCLQDSRVSGLLSRADDSPGLRALLADPDASFPGRERALKNGNTCTVWATDVADQRLVVKRYNVKNFWHGLKLTTRAGRAFLSWDNARKLLAHGIATPRPVAVVRIKKGLLRPIAYLVMEQLQGMGAQIWFRDQGISAAEREQMVLSVVELLHQLEILRVTHGDLKAANILIVAGQPVLIDLDAMCWHENESRFRRAYSADLHRFLQNWGDEPGLLQLFRERFSTVFSRLGDV